MRTALMALLGVVSLASPAHTQQEPQDPGAFEVAEVVRDQQRRFGIPRPVGWTFHAPKEQETSNVPMQSLKVYEVKVRTVEFGEFDLILDLLTGGSQDLHRQARFEHNGFLALPGYSKERCAVHYDPIPHFTCSHEKRPDRVQLAVFRFANGRNVSVSFVLATKHLDKARPVLLSLAQKITVDLAFWPERPPGFEIEQDDGILLGFPTEVADRERREARKLVASIVKSFEKFHGPHGWSDEFPFEIYFHDGERTRELLLLDAPAVLQYRMMEDADSIPPMRRCVSVVPRTPLHRARLASAIVQGLLFRRYPNFGCQWVLLGERQVASLEHACGKPLPFVPEDYAAGIRRLRLGLAEMVAKPDDVTFADAGTWAAYFRIGAPKHGKAYKAMLAELDTALDPASVLQRFAASFEADELHREVRKTLDRKLKTVK